MPKFIKPQTLSFLCAVNVQAKNAAEPTARRTFTIDAYTGEAMNIYPFDLPVVVDMATLDLSVQTPPALFDHNPADSHIVGQVERLTVEQNSLRASGFFVLDAKAEKARVVVDKADQGYKWQASIGGEPTSMSEIKAGETIALNGRTYTGPLYVGSGVVIREVSFVVLGGDRRTSAVVARHKSKNPNRAIRAGVSPMSFEEWLMSLGFADPAALDPVQTANLQQMYNKAYPAEGGEPKVEEPPVTGSEPPVPEEPKKEEPPPTAASAKAALIQARLKAEAEAERQVARLRQIAANYKNPDIEVIEAGKKKSVPLLAHALENGWSGERTELEALRNYRSNSPAVIVRGRDKDCTLEALQGAMILRANGRLDHKAYQTRQAVAMGLPGWLRAGLNSDQRQKAMEFAHKFSSMSMLDLCREVRRLDGLEATHDRRELIQAAFSGGGSLSNVFTTNVNAILLAEYMEAMDTTQGWVTEADVSDFKTNERPRVELGEGLKRHPRNSTADHAKFSDNVESYKISRYSKQFEIDEQDMIDDNFGIFADTPKRFGLAAARLRPDLVYALLLSNPTLTATGRALFNATDGNLLTGAALAAAKLKAAISAMMLVRENSVTLNLTPTHLLVPPTLLWTAKELVTSATIIIAGTAGSVTERGSANTIADLNLNIVSDGRLENGVVNPVDDQLQTGSASTWYSASTLAHTIEVGYLAGTGRAPSVRSSPLEKGRWGMNWDVNLDIGVKALDWKGFNKNTA